MTRRITARVRVLFATVLAFGIMYEATAQTGPDEQAPVTLGVYGAVNVNIHAANFDSIPGFPNCCSAFTGGNGIGLAAGGLIEIPINKFLKFQSRVGYSQIGAEMTKLNDIGLTRVVRAPGDTVFSQVNVNHRIKANLAMIGIEPGVAFQFFEVFHVSLGLGASLLMTSTFDQDETINSPDGVRFTTGSRIRNNFTDRALPDVNALQLHGYAGAYADIPVARQLILAPEVRFYLPIMNVVSGLDWKAAILQFGLAIKVPLLPSNKVTRYDTVIVRDTQVVERINIADGGGVRFLDRTKRETSRTDGNIEFVTTTIRESYLNEISKSGRFDVDLEVYGVLADGTRQQMPTIRVEEIETEEGFPLLPQVFFPDGSADLTRAGLRLLTTTGAESFSEISLQSNTLDIYSDVLNIVGYRMQRIPGSILTLTGHTNGLPGDKAVPGLARQRADAVKDYLTKVWNIPSNRVTVQSGNLPPNPANNTIVDGQEENRRAEMASQTYDVLKPVILKEVQRTTSPPVIEISPKINSELGVSSWTSTVKQGAGLLRTYNGSSMPGVQVWRLEEEPRIQLELPAEVSLTARDQAGTERTVSKSLTVQQLTIKKKRSEMMNDKRIERFALIVFDFNSATLSRHNQRVLDEVKRRITPNSKVKISGYADRTGEESYNLELARSRCMEAQKYLQVPTGNVTIDAVGSSRLLYDNNLPQGRSYSRTVVVTIETPVN